MGERRTTEELGRASAGPSDVEAERAMVKGREIKVELANELEGRLACVNMRGWDMGRVMKRSEGGMVSVFNDQGRPGSYESAFWGSSCMPTR